MSTDDAPNTKHYTVPMPVPRDSREYRKSEHFLKREKYRTPEIRPWIVEELLQEGTCHGAEEANRFTFEREIWSRDGTHDWVLVVALDPEAFREADRKHRLVTAYCVCCPKEEDLP